MNRYQYYYTAEVYRKLDKLESYVNRRTQENEDIVFPELHEAQRDVIAKRKKYNVICFGRRAGKTMLGVWLVLETLMRRQLCGWISPVYRMTNEIQHILANYVKKSFYLIQRQYHHYQLYQDGGILKFFSLERPENLRGLRFHRIIIDEAAFAKKIDLDTFFFNTVMPTLLDFDGDAYIMSTPQGYDGFSRLYERGLSDSETEWKSFHNPTDVNPYIKPDVLQELIKSLPSFAVQQEIYAQFVSQENAIFPHIEELAVIQQMQFEGVLGRSYIIGLDVGQMRDYTAIVVLDVTEDPYKMVFFHRFKSLSFEAQSNIIVSISKKFFNPPMYIERIGYGISLMESLSKSNLQVVGVSVDYRTKTSMIENLVKAFQNKSILILNEKTVVQELYNYQAVQTAAGWKYRAAPGGHDDIVMALALAVFGVTKIGIPRYAFV